MMSITGTMNKTIDTTVLVSSRKKDRNHMKSESRGTENINIVGMTIMTNDTK